MNYSYEKKHDVVIVGGGVIGLAIAYFLARESQGRMKIAVLDRTVLGDEASGGAAGMLAAQIESEAAGPFLDLQVQSREIFKWLAGELEDSTGINIQYAKKGIAALAFDASQEKTIKERFERQKRDGLPGRWLSSEEVVQQFPFLKKKSLGGFLASEDGMVSAGRLFQAYAAAATDLGAEIFESESFEGTPLKGPKQDFLETNLYKFAADKFIFAAGPWTGKLLAGAVPIEPVKGQILIYETPPGWNQGWQTPVYLGTTPQSGIPCYMAPKGGSEVWVGATVEKKGFDKTENAQASEEMAKYVSEMVPEFSTFPLRSVWVGLRPGTPDGLPLLGLLPGFENVYVASGHFRNGILLSAVTGKIFADLFLKGQSSVNLSPFSPARFSKTFAKA